MNGNSFRSRTILFLAVFLLALLVLVPMRIGLNWSGITDRGFAAREAMGSVWNGRLADAQFGDSGVGSIDAGLSPASLLLGRARLSLRRSSGAPSTFGDIRGALTVSGGRSGLDDMHASLPASWLFAPLPVSALELENMSVQFEDGQCVSADGLARARLGVSAGGVALPDSLLGTAACENGDLLLPLISQSGMEQMDIRIDGDRNYAVELRVMAANEDMRQQLAQAGFAPGANGYSVSVQGSF